MDNLIVTQSEGVPQVSPFKRRAKILFWIPWFIAFLFIPIFAFFSFGLAMSMGSGVSQNEAVFLFLSVFGYAVLFSLLFMVVNIFVYLFKSYDLSFYLSLLAVFTEIVAVISFCLLLFS
jgi:hypothetical protein